MIFWFSGLHFGTEISDCSCETGWHCNVLLALSENVGTAIFLFARTWHVCTEGVSLLLLSMRHRDFTVCSFNVCGTEIFSLLLSGTLAQGCICLLLQGLLAQNSSVCPISEIGTVMFLSAQARFVGTLVLRASRSC